jgi:glutathione S-transferase
LSPFVRKARVAFIEKGIAYELDPVLPFNQTPEYLEMSPLGKIPCYTTPDGQHIPDSSVIIAYLEKAHPEKPLYPSNAGDLARALFGEEYGDTALVQACGTVFFQRFVAPLFLSQPTDEKLVENALEVEVPKAIAWIDKQIAGKDFLVGDRLTVADIALCSPLVNLRHGGGDFDRSRFPEYARYSDAILARESFASVIKEEKDFLAQAA